MLIAMMAKTFDENSNQVLALWSAVRNVLLFVCARVRVMCGCVSISAFLPCTYPQVPFFLSLFSFCVACRFFPFAARVLRFERMLSDADRARLRSVTPHTWYVAVLALGSCKSAYVSDKFRARRQP